MAAHFAAERNTGLRTLALLVESGADLSARDEDGNTPLDTARLNGKVRLVGVDQESHSCKRSMTCRTGRRT
jgi:ankyrin repeat protein